MAVIKYHAIKRDANGKIVDEQWIPIYADAINNRARRDYNLSDLHSVSDARKNLGLVGDVTDISNSHNHDKRYNEWRQADKLANESARANLDSKFTKAISDNYIEMNAKLDKFNQNFANLNAATNSRLTAEVNDRADADTALNKRVDTTNTNLSNETQNRINADNNLQGQINTNKNNIKINKDNLAATNTKLATETSTRASEDTRLSNRIESVNTTLTNSLNAEITNRKNADNELSKRITTNTNNLATETTNRTSADSALDKRVTTNTNSINSHTNSLNNHGSRITTLESAKNNHESRIVTLEGAKTTTNNNLNAEITNRKNGDNALSNRVTALEKKFWVQSGDPGGNAPNGAIWFHTGNRLIYYRSGNSWVPFGAIWL